MFGFTRNVIEMGEALVANESQIAELRIEQVVLINGLDNGVPVVTSQSSRAIPPVIRNAVTHRDEYVLDERSPPGRRTPEQTSRGARAGPY